MIAAAGSREREPRRALVFSGGGARGAYEAGVVRYLTEDLPRCLGRDPRIDIVCGTSVGAIHACYIAATAHEDGARGSRLVDVWTSMRLDEILPLSLKDTLRLPARLLGLRGLSKRLKNGSHPNRIYGLMNIEPLEKLVMDSIPWRSIHRNVESGRIGAVCVTATQISTGRVVNFIENTGEIPQWTRDPTIIPRKTRLHPNHALASAAIPILFPAVQIGSAYYADGGLRLNTPLVPAIRLGADRVLVVALRQNLKLTGDKAIENQKSEDYGSPMFLFGKVLNALLLDHLDTDLARMHLMNEIIGDGEEVYGEDFLPSINKIADAKRGQRFRKIDDLVVRPSKDLGVLAGQILREMPRDKARSPLIRWAARSLDRDKTSTEADLLSYLLFDGEFLAPLAELGYQDARAREEELCAFFS